MRAPRLQVDPPVRSPLRPRHRPPLRLLFLLLAALPLTVGAAGAEEARAPAPLGEGRHHLTLQSGGFRRHAVVEVPPQVRLGRPLPVVLGLHGAGGSGAQFLDQNGWAALARSAGFVALGADGLPIFPRWPASFLTNPTVWNNGDLAPDGERSRIDDVAFLAALLDDLARRVAIDRKRIYVTGHSAGAGMTFRLAAALAPRFAAIAPVASHCWIADPRPRRPLPTLYLIGSEDPLVPVDGGIRDLPWGPPEEMPPVADTLERWGRALGCEPGLPPQLDEGPGLSARHFGGCRGGVPFSAWYIAGQGHGWPGGESDLPPALIGPSVDTLDATDFIWRFFRARIRR